MFDEQSFLKLQKELKILRKKLARSEANRITLEEMWDRNSKLFETLNKEIEEQRHLIHQKSEELYGLAQKLAKYLSPQVYNSIFTGERDVRLETYRKKLTIFFSDIVGFTSKTDSMEPEDLTFMLNSYLDSMAQIVQKYGGTLDKFIGDAVLVFYGDPETKGVQEDALACVQMAVDMQQSIRVLQKKWSTHGIGGLFQVRMGITTGFCTVGNFGSEERMDYTIIGNRVNLASRLESNASPGRILISEDTYSLVKEHFDFEQKDPIQAKGFERPVDVFQLLLTKSEAELKRAMEVNFDGFTLKLDPKNVSKSSKNDVLAALNEAVNKLSTD